MIWTTSRTRLLRAGAILFAAALAAVISVGLVPPAAAATGDQATLGQEDREDLERIERYLNNVRTMTARFLQSTSEGGYAEGTLFISRPGRLRIEYDPPVPVLIVSDGEWIHYFDEEIRQVNRLRLSETPAQLLVRNRLQLGEKVRVVGFERGPGTIRVTLEDMDHPDAGRLTLVFADRPLMLRQWKVTDAQGVETTVAIYDTHKDVPLNPTLFEFEAPADARVPFGGGAGRN